MQYDEKTKTLLNLLTNLSSDYLSEDKISNIINEFENIYSNEDGNQYRHMYFQIYTHVINLRPESREVLQTNLDKVKNILCPSQPKNQVDKSFLKIYDHILLESQREGTFASHKQIMDEYQQIVMQENENNAKTICEMEATKQEISDFRKEMDSFHTQSITVLSIFTGIVMAFFGGFTILGGAFQNIGPFKNYSLYFLICLVGFILFNTIFVLIYSAAKISGKTIAVTCKEKTCQKCSGCKECQWHAYCLVCRMNRKYPYVLYVNVVLVVAGIFFFINI